MVSLFLCVLCSPWLDGWHIAGTQRITAGGHLVTPYDLKQETSAHHFLEMVI